MSKAILILGESGTGKSTSLRNLPPSETFIVNVLGKSLPFRGSRKNYTPLVKNEGNMYESDDYLRIKDCVLYVNSSRPEIKYLVIDDLGYTLQNDYLRKASAKGYDKFTEMGKLFGELIESIRNLRDDLFVFVTMHVEIDAHGKTKPKTVGKMVDNHVVIEGRFTFVLHTLVIDNDYRFITNHDGMHMAKTPMDMFPMTIPNDLMEVVKTINAYEDGE